MPKDGAGWNGIRVREKRAGRQQPQIERGLQAMPGEVRADRRPVNRRVPRGKERKLVQMTDVEAAVVQPLILDEVVQQQVQDAIGRRQQPDVLSIRRVIDRARQHFVDRQQRRLVEQCDMQVDRAGVLRPCESPSVEEAAGIRNLAVAALGERRERGRRLAGWNEDIQIRYHPAGRVCIVAREQDGGALEQHGRDAAIVHGRDDLGELRLQALVANPVEAGELGEVGRDSVRHGG